MASGTVNSNWVLFREIVRRGQGALKKKEGKKETRRGTTEVDQIIYSTSIPPWSSRWHAARENESVGSEEREREERKGDLEEEVATVKKEKGT
jgi:hypothetical protein